MVWYADAASVDFSPDSQSWHDLFKREAPAEEESDEGGGGIGEKIKAPFVKMEHGVEKAADKLAEKTHIPTW